MSGRYLYVLFLAGSLLAWPLAAEQSVTVGQNDLLPLWSDDSYLATTRAPEPDPSVPVIGPKAKGLAATFLRLLGDQAAGFDGVLYDNRDRGHSTLPPNLFPQLARINYAPDLRRAGLDYGLAGSILFPGIVLGNSSTALTSGPAPRSQVRFAMTQPHGPLAAHRGYVSNALYVYPEHRDHDARDLYPANWPYTVTSQGSSGSDQRFLRALAMTLAAFTPETRVKLEAEGLIAPTLQMILRRNLVHIVSRQDYLSGAAHPPVFNGKHLRPIRMVVHAASMRPETIPPMARLDVIEESFLLAAGSATLSERLFDTPAAVARIWRGAEFRKSLTVSADRSFDANGLPLDFTWVLLRGNPAHVRIEPFGPGGARARIELTWHDPSALAPPRTWPRAAPRPRPSARIDIGVFASNGSHDSAPAILSILLPLHEGRLYAPGPDGKRVLKRTKPRPDIPADPLLFPQGSDIDK